MASREDFVNVVLSQVGKTDPSEGYKYSKYTGTYEQPWCASFIAWCAKEAGIGSDVIPKTASTQKMKAFAKEKGLWKSGTSIPVRGDIIFYVVPKNLSALHVGVVTSPLMSTDGNWSEAVSTHPIRTTYAIDGFFSPNFSSSSLTSNRFVSSGSRTSTLKMEKTEEANKKVYETSITGTDYFAGVQDEYKIYLNDREITDFMGEDLETEDDIEAISVTASFGVAKNPKDKYLTASTPNPQLGDKVRICNNEKELFRGIVMEVSLDGRVTAFDYGYYLNKQEIILQCNQVSASDALRALCNKVSVPVGNICSIPTVITHNYIGSAPSDIINDILGQATAEQGKNYLYRVEDGALNIKPYPTKVTVAQHKQIYGKSFDVTWLLGGVSGSKTIEQLRNKIQMISNDGEILSVAESAESQNKYGVLQTQITVDAEEVSKANSMAQNKLKELNVITEDYTIDKMFGSDDVKSGVILNFSSAAYGVEGLYLVTNVRHSYFPEHTMSLALRKVVVI